MKYVLLLISIFCAAYTVDAQQKVYSEKEYAKSPVWIQMIRDTSVNFFDAEKAFTTYFRHHEKPQGEQEDIGEHAKREKYPSKSEQRKMQRENHMRMEVKKYEHWHQMMLPFVQPDGRILTPAERIQIWKDQKNKR